MNKTKMNMVVMMVVVAISMATGVFVGATVSNALADPVTETGTTGNLKDAISELTNDDLDILLKGMDVETIERTIAIVGDTGDVQKFVGTYCMLDPEYANVVITYAGK